MDTLKDGGGVIGHILHYAFILFLTGSALLVFIYFWRKGRLDMDEGPKHQMMKNNDEG